MRSIPAALTWDLWSRSKWEYLLVVPGALVVPVLVISILRLEHGIDLQDASIQTFQMVLVAMQALGCAGIALQPSAHPSRLYARPISTPDLVVWHLVPAAVAGALTYIASAGVLDLLFGTNWPLLGPSLFVAVSIMTAQAVAWLTRHNLLLQAAGLWTSGMGLVFWLVARFHGLNAPRGVGDRSDHRLWTVVTSGELFTLGVVAACAGATAVYAIRRDRRGDTLAWPRITAWFDRRTASTARPARPFRSAASADLWREWRHVGWILPVATLAVCSLLGIGRLFSNDAHGFAGFHFLLPLIGWIGAFLGISHVDPRGSAMGGFLATRPVADSQMSGATLKMAALAVLLSAFIWFPFFIGLRATLSDPPQLALDVQLAATFALVVATWMFAASLASITMSGRPQLLGLIIGGTVTLWVLGMFLQRYGVPPAYQDLIDRWAGYLVVLATACGTLIAFFAAWRRALIGTRTIFAAALLWLALAGSAPVLIARLPEPRPDAPPLPRSYLTILAAGAMGLAVFPFAAAPLAVHWNRHR